MMPLNAAATRRGPLGSRMKRRPYDQGCDRPTRPPPGRAICLVGGKGGIGKSTLALNLAIALSRQGRSVSLLDAADQFAHTDLMLVNAADLQVGSDDTGLSIQHFDERRLEGADVRVRGKQEQGWGGLPPRPAGWKPAPPGEMMPTRLEGADDAIASRLRNLRRYHEALLIDCGSNLSERTIGLAMQSDMAILVATPEPTALTDAYATAKMLARRGYRNSMGLVVNMARSRREACETVRRLVRACAQFLDLSLERLGEVPLDRHAAHAARSRRPLLVTSPRCAAARRIEQIARRIPLPICPVASSDGTLWMRVASLFL